MTSNKSIVALKYILGYKKLVTSHFQNSTSKIMTENNWGCNMWKVKKLPVLRNHGSQKSRDSLLRDALLCEL